MVSFLLTLASGCSQRGVDRCGGGLPWMAWCAGLVDVPGCQSLLEQSRGVIAGLAEGQMHFGASSAQF